MFNLVIHAVGTTWETDQLMRFPKDRFKESSHGIEGASVNLDDQTTLKQLEGISTLLMYERNADGPHPDMVRYGHIRELRIADQDLVFRFDEVGTFDRSIVNEFSDRLDIGKFEQTRTHWAIKDGDLPRAMLDKLRIMKPSCSPFISYAHEDAEAAKRLFKDLSRADSAPWLDSEKLLGGQNWETAIRDAIRSSTHFLALISKNSVDKRGFVQKELADALEILKEFPPNQVFVIPLRLDNSAPRHEQLRQLHRIDLFPDYEDGFNRLLQSLGLDKRVGAGVIRQPTDSKKTEVIEAIRARAERDHPDDYSTQKYVIENELAALRALTECSAPDVPSQIFDGIKQRAQAQHPDEFSTQLYVIETEVAAWRKLKEFRPQDVPGEVLKKITLKAERDFPQDFGTRLYVIEEQVNAWKHLHGT